MLGLRASSATRPLVDAEAPLIGRYQSLHLLRRRRRGSLHCSTSIPTLVLGSSLCILGAGFSFSFSVSARVCFCPCVVDFCLGLGLCLSLALSFGSRPLLVSPPAPQLPQSRRPFSTARPVSVCSSREPEDVAISRQRGRPGGRADIAVPTAPHADVASSASPRPATLNAPANANRRLNTLSQQPVYPGASSPAPDLAAAAAAALHHHHQAPPRHPLGPPEPTLLPSPFRGLATSSSRRPRRLSAARLWNPTNSTPRTNPSRRRRRPSTPQPPSVPLQHPTLDDSNHLVGTGAGDYPLLTLPEQRQTRHSGSTRASLQIDLSGSADHRVSLPRSLRASYDEKRSQISNQRAQGSDAGPSRNSWRDDGEHKATKLDKGKGKAIMVHDDEAPRSFSKDLERGPDVMDPRPSNVSGADGIGSAMSSTNSSIMGEEVQPDAAGEWGPQHPCFPHMNPHVPIDSAEYVNTRIIRIRRDWLLEGDLAPTFSNLYPEILDPAGLSEQEFRRVIEKLNGELVPVFNPYNVRNIVDGVLGLVTGWLWDDFGFTGIKSRLSHVEKWIEKWNLEMEKTMGSEEGSVAPKLISLRRTGYMSLDIQIPDPEIAPAPSTTNDSRTALPLEPVPAVTI